MSILRFTHIGICVTEPERSIGFYRDLLGFRLRSELRVSGEPSDTLLQLRDVDLRAIYLERDGARIELLHYASPGTVGTDAPREMNRLGLTHLSLRVDDLAATVDRLRAAGVRVLDRSRIDIPDFGSAAVFVCDPDGTLIELVQSPGDLEAPPGGG
jgi:catechol 2,3-dioxygenase-like lactoylglutathione lyase family enzyme